MEEQANKSVFAQIWLKNKQYSGSKTMTHLQMEDRNRHARGSVRIISITLIFKLLATLSREELCQNRKWVFKVVLNWFQITNFVQYLNGTICSNRLARVEWSKGRSDYRRRHFVIVGQTSPCLRFERLKQTSIETTFCRYFNS